MTLGLCESQIIGMIRAVIAMNDQGKPRLVKFYDYQPVEKQQELIRSIYGVLCSRAENVSNFIQADPIFGPDAQLVYKTYDTLYFVFIFDSAENELAMLDLMQVFVETLDKCFSNVCELDIVFNFNKVGKGLKYNSGCPKIYSWLACSIAHDFSSRWRMIEGEKASMLKENKKEQHNLDSTIENPV